MNPAPRHIPATPADLAGWCGRTVRVCGTCGSKNIRVDCSYCGDSTFDHECNEGCRDCGGPEIRAFDTRDAAHRDHLIRRYHLPSWHRDTPGGLTPEQSAAVVLGSVLRVRAGLEPIRLLLTEWSIWSGYRWARHQYGEDRQRQPFLGIEYGTEAPGRWHAFARRDGFAYAHGDEGTAEAAKLAADASALANGLALRVPEGILLPPLTPGGEPVLWSTP